MQKDKLILSCLILSVAVCIIVEMIIVPCGQTVFDVHEKRLYLWTVDSARSVIGN